MGKGNRMVPILFGLILWGIALTLFWFFHNFVTATIGGLFLILGWKTMRLGLFATQTLIDEMCLPEQKPSAQTEKEWGEEMGLGDLKKPSTRTKVKSPEFPPEKNVHIYLAKGMAFGQFKDWPQDLKNYRKMIGTQGLFFSQGKTFEVEVAALVRFIGSSAILSEDAFGLNYNQSKDTQENYDSVAEELLSKFGWKEPYLEKFRKIRNSRFTEYLDLAVGNDFPGLGISFFKHALPNTEFKGRFVKSALVVSAHIGAQISGFREIAHEFAEGNSA